MNERFLEGAGEHLIEGGAEHGHPSSTDYPSYPRAWTQPGAGSSHRNGKRRDAHGALVLIDLVTQEGITGSSYIRCYTPLALQPLVYLVANCEELLKGQTAAPATVERQLQQHVRLLGTQGLIGMAIAGIDMALWDARARACGLNI
jgi:L-alanine-DL-glutamate epimerase-like enolase superfamily enzyme